MPATAPFRVTAEEISESDEGQEGLGSIKVSVSLFQTRVSFASLGFLQFSVQVGFPDSCN